MDSSRGRAQARPPARPVRSRREVVGVSEFAAVRLSDGLEQQVLLFRRHAEWLSIHMTENGHLLAFRKGVAFNDDGAVRYRPSGNLHVVILPSSPSLPIRRNADVAHGLAHRDKQR